jgi:hypothetical protein
MESKVTEFTNGLVKPFSFLPVALIRYVIVPMLGGKHHVIASYQQVCNLADCVKVAVDFVSPENVSRCEKLTREFREQNQSMVWKEDVLQLRTMMWFAWLSCRLQESTD